MFKVYDYVCPVCGNTLQDVLVKNKERVICSKCSVDMRRQLSAPGMLKTNFADKPRVR